MFLIKSVILPLCLCTCTFALSALQTACDADTGCVYFDGHAYKCSISGGTPDYHQAICEGTVSLYFGGRKCEWMLFFYYYKSISWGKRIFHIIVVEWGDKYTLPEYKQTNVPEYKHLFVPSKPCIISGNPKTSFLADAGTMATGFSQGTMAAIHNLQLHKLKGGP